MIPDPTQHETTRDRLARLFENFAIHGTDGISPLYSRLTRVVASDSASLDLAAHAPREPIPNLLFAAVHYLLLKGVRHPLAAYYASVVNAHGAGEAAPADDDAVLHFRDFCRQYRQEIIELLQTRLVQTNEVNRCTALLPAFGQVAQMAGQPLALAEIGASAGLNLLWDRYSYDDGSGRTAGASDSSLRLVTERRGDRVPPLPNTLPQVGYRVGLDLHPVDVRDDDAVLWLQALVWPSHGERAERLRQAVHIARATPPRLLAGDALALLPVVLPDVPADMALCVYHTFVINQFLPEGRDQLTALLATHSRQRPIYRVSIEWLRTEHPQLELSVYRDGVEADHRLLARCEGHGRWLEWLG